MFHVNNMLYFKSINNNAGVPALICIQKTNYMDELQGIKKFDKVGNVLKKCKIRWKCDSVSKETMPPDQNLLISV